MAHLRHGGHRTGDTPHEWLRVGAEIATLANTWAARGDLVAYVGPGAGGPAPACFAPELAEIEVNVDVAFGRGIDPKDIGSLLDKSNRYTWARACGAIYHEAMHAKFSQWSVPAAAETLKSDEFNALMLLEEGRIEALGIRDDYKAKVFLRACAMDLVIGDAKERMESEPFSIRSAANLVALVYPRLMSGILDVDEVKPLTDILEEALGLDLIDSLTALIAEAQAHTIHNNAEDMYQTARDWADLVREASEEAGEPQPGENGEPQPGEGGEPGETPTGGGKGLSDLMDDIMEAMQEIAEAVEIANADDLADQEEREKWADIAKERADLAKERDDHSRVASKIFMRGKEGGGKSHSVLIGTRAPLPGERSAAIVVARQLERAKYRERDLTDVNSELPPGRLRTRGLVQAAAQRAQGRMVKAEPWRRTMRKHTDEPTLTIGVMVDISGSMGAAMEPMATTAWVMSEAGRRVQARSAMVYFGNTVFPTLKPGEHLKDVAIYTAPDGTEKFDYAFKALDGSLNLLYGKGARLLVVVSDGCYTADESRKASHWMRRCQDNGVAVLWLPFDHGMYATDHCKSTTATVVPGFLDPAAAAMQIGKAAADSMTKIGQRAG